MESYPAIGEPRQVASQLSRALRSSATHRDGAPPMPIASARETWYSRIQVCWIEEHGVLIRRSALYVLEGGQRLIAL
jgi:hypothetical protein